MAFAKYDINTVENFPVREISEDKILSDNQRAMKHNLLMLVPPFQEQTMVKNLGSADESGFAEVNE